MSEILLTIDGIALPMGWAGDVSSEEGVFGGFEHLRMANGVVVYQERWVKRRLRLFGNAWRAEAFEGVDWRGGFELGWIKPQGAVQAGNIFTLPAARRADLDPFAFSNRGCDAIPAVVSVVGDVATVTADPGADSYSCHWFPVLTMVSQGPTSRHDITQGAFAWEITAEEI